MNKLKSGRIILDEEAKSALSSMYNEIKDEECVKITPAKLSSWIIQKFHTSYFRQHKTKITKDHFNSKEYLKDMMKNVGAEENLEEVLRKALSNIKTPRTSKSNDKKDSRKEQDQEIS
jgi:hypothetical protein